MPKIIIVEISIKEVSNEEVRDFFWKSMNLNVLINPYKGASSCENDPFVSWMVDNNILTAAERKKLERVFFVRKS